MALQGNLEYAWVSLIYNTSTILWLDNGSHAADRSRVFSKKGQRITSVSPCVIRIHAVVGWLTPRQAEGTNP